MRIVLEHFAFIPTMINVHNEKVQHTIIYSFFSLTFMFISGAFEYMANHVLGLSVAFTISLFFIMISDLILGISASIVEGKRKGIKKRTILKSKRGLSWVVKFGVYIMLINSINSLHHETTLINIPLISEVMQLIKLYTLLHILIWELKSIDENLNRLNVSVQVLKKIVTFGFKGKDKIENKINKKLEDNDTNK